MSRPASDDGYGDARTDRWEGQPEMPSSTPDNPVESIERLASLHRSGKLTDAEFASGKATVLGLGAASQPNSPAGPTARPRTRPVFKVLAGVIVAFAAFMALLVAIGDPPESEPAVQPVEFATDVRGFAPVSPSVLRVQTSITNNSDGTTAGGRCMFFAAVAGVDASKFLDGSGTFDRTLEPGESFVLLASIGINDGQAAYVDEVTAICDNDG